MKTIWKFPMPAASIRLRMPVGAEILCVQMQHGVPCFWAIVDPEAERENREFFVLGTGQELGEVGKYLGTFQLQGGDIVFHLFEAP